MKDIEGSIEYGPDLLPQISEGFSKTVSRPLTKETASKLKDQIKIPSNCKGFAVPKMNSEIWAHLPTGQGWQISKLNKFNNQLALV